MDGGERLTVIGDPIGHSLSPAMHTAALAAAGLDWSYEAHYVSASELAEWYETVGQALRGFNVTIPHKTAVVSLVDELDSDARTIGAVNTVVMRDGWHVGYNTDPAGFLAALLQAGFDPSGCSVVIFGAGGAAMSVVHALRPCARQITVASRRAEVAQHLSGGNGMSLDDPGLLERIVEADLLVNATPLGMAHLSDASPLPPVTRLRPDMFVVDLVYGRDTPFLRTARVAGCVTQDGLEMLVQQGAASFRLWTGLEPDIDAMRRACRESLVQHA